SSSARSSIQEPSRAAAGRSTSALTTLQDAPPSVVLAIPLNGASLGARRRPRRPTYATSPWLAEAAMGPRLGFAPLAGPQAASPAPCFIAPSAPLASRQARPPSSLTAMPASVVT